MKSSIALVLAAALALSPADRKRFLRQLKDCGILEHQPRGEYKAVRNDRIRTMHRRGLTPGQIARLEGMTRNAVRMVLYRSKRAGHVGQTCALSARQTLKP